MSELASFLQKFVPAVERYLLSKDKTAYINSLAVGDTPKMLELLLKSDYDNQLEKKLTKIGIPYDFAIKFKLMKLIEAFTKSEEPSEELFEDLKRNFPMSFSHSRPLDPIESDQVDNTQVRSIQNCKLVLQQNLPQYIEKKLRENSNFIYSVNQYTVLTVDPKYWMELKASQKEAFLTQRVNILKHFNEDFIVNFIVFMRKQKRAKQHPTFLLGKYYLENLTKGMINKIYQKEKDVINQMDFFEVWLKANHGEALKPILTNSQRNESISQKEEKKKVLKQLIKTIQAINSHHAKTLRELVTFQILLTDLAMQNPQKKEFIDFLNSLKVTSRNLSSSYRQQIIKKYGEHQSQSRSFGGFIFNQKGWDISTLIKAYVKGLYEKQNSPDQLTKDLSPFIQDKLLNKTCLLAKLAKGQVIQETQGIISKAQLKELQEKKEITILAKNKRDFKVTDQVVLSLKVKNVKVIRVKIYEIDLEKKNMTTTVYSDFGSENLSYLEPVSSFVKEVENSNPFKESYYDMPIKEIGKKAGAFIVDLEGDGILSRAAIRKGAMVCQTRTTSAGVQIKFFDEEGETVQDLLLWIQGKKVTVKNSYTFPFGVNNQNFKIVAVKDSNSQIFTVNVPRQQYEFETRFFYTHESFIVGNKAKIVVSPRLTVGKKPVSLKLIKNSKIEIILTDNHNVKSMLNYDSIQWSPKQDYVLEFPIQAYTNSIKITVTGEIEGYSQKTINLTQNHEINISLMENTTDYVDIYLKKSKGQYEAYILGLNGQTVGSCQAFVSYRYRGLLNFQDKQLKTDQNGKLYLGKLSNIAELSIEARGIKRQWYIDNSKASRFGSELCFQKNLTFREGQKISLPLPGQITLKDLAFTRFCKGIPIGVDFKENLQINENRIQYPSAKQGTYVLEIFPLEQKVNIRVIKGKPWGGKVYDSQSGKLYEINHNANQSIGIGSMTSVTNQNSTNCKVELNIGQQQNTNVKVHAFAYNFIHPNIPNLNFAKPGGKYKEDAVSEPYRFPESEFINNRILSDEECYVKNRVQSEKFIGNNLEKPRIFLKRIDVRETNSLEQELQEGGGGGGGQNECHMMRNQRGEKCCDMRARRSSNLQQRYFKQRECVNEFNSHNNFLALPCIGKTNLKGGSVQISVPKGYQNLKVIVVSEKSIIQKQFSLCETQASSKIQTKDLRHGGLEQNDQKSGWTMSRECYPVQKGETLKINRNSQWTAVSLSNILNFANIKGAKVDDWTLSWKSYSRERKLKIYDKEYCHQLNVYLNENDPQFFSEVVKPFIQNKITKTFVDLYLLQDARCAEWLSIPKLQQLNSFEVILLIKHLLKNGNKKQAQAIARRLQLHQKSNKISSSVFNHQFDTVINAKEGEKKPNAQIFAGKNKKAKRNKQKVAYQQSSNFDYIQRCSMPQSQMAMQQMKECDQLAMLQDQNEFQQDDDVEMRAQYKQAFQPMQKTKEYTQITYSKIKNPNDSRTLVQPALFWAKLAVHLIENPGKDFLSQSFLYLDQKLQFTLASCFIPNNSNSEFQIETEGQNFVIQAKNSFLVLVKEVKQIPFESKFGVMINQRFFDPFDRKIYQEDGTELDKEAEQFLVRQVYSSQSVVTNTSGTSLDLQVLLDIPEGAIPLESHQYTQIISATVSAYSTKSFERKFYFPKEGTYSFYSANACRGKTIISKADSKKDLLVKKFKTIHNKENLSDILRSGNQEHILDYISNKNIFDENIFIPEVIYWMLSQKGFYQKVIKILKGRKYYDTTIWSFAFLHKDKNSILEYFQKERWQDFSIEAPIFEYFPYYSSRTHKFQNQGKSNIRNVQFKETYYKFLLATLVKNLFENPQESGKVKLTMIYYLLLQDRISQVNQIVQSFTEQNRNTYKIQIDYIQCYVDICQGFPEFKKARQIAAKYSNYPVQSWGKLFKEVTKILKEYDSDEVFSQKTKIQYQTKVIRNQQELKISIPPETQVRVSYHAINLELFFSLFPFSTFNFNQPIKPKEIITLASGQAREQKIIRPSKYTDVFVVIEQVNSQKVCKRVESFHWVNPELKVKVTEKEGTVKVFYKGKKISGCYCKVYSDGNNGQKFYRDGYTDITGTFKYVMADLQGIRKFAILIMTDNGGSIVNAGMPDMNGILQ